MVDEAVDGGQCHGRVGKDLVPLAAWLVGGDEQGPTFISRADQSEQDAGLGGLGLISCDRGEIVENQQGIFVELGDRGFEVEIAARGLSFCTRSVAREQHTPFRPALGRAPPPDETCRCRAVRRTADWLPFRSSVAGGERLDLGLGDHRHSRVVEGVQGLSRRQSRFVPMALEASPVPFDNLLLAERGQEAGGGPALLVGPRRQRSPGQPDSGSRNSTSISLMRAGSVVSVAFIAIWW